MMKKYWNNNSGKLWRISQPCFCAFVHVVARILRLFPVWVTSMGNLTQAGADLRWAAVFLSPLADGMFFHLLVVKSCKTNKNLFALMLHAWVISNTTSSFFHTLTTKEFIWFIFPWCIFSSDFKSSSWEPWQHQNYCNQGQWTCKLCLWNGCFKITTQVFYYLQSVAKWGKKLNETTDFSWL